MTRLVFAVARLVIKAAVVLAVLVLLGGYAATSVALVGIAGPIGLVLVVVGTAGLGALLLREDRQRRSGR